MIDQPGHATYEASWYAFHDNGALEHVRDCATGGQVPTGFVTDATRSHRCIFGSTWSAPDETTLVIDGECSDGNTREVVLQFPPDQSANSTGQAQVDVVSVDRNGGWSHAPWAWVWQKCTDASCTPSASDLCQ